MAKKLYRSRNNQVLAGVCGGLAEYVNMDPTIIRVLWAIFVFFGGSGVLAYIICAIIIPQSPQGYESDSEHYTIYDRDGHQINNESNASSRMTLGIILIVVGVLFFISRFFRWISIGQLWPVAIIGIGLLILFSGRKS